MEEEATALISNFLERLRNPADSAQSTGDAENPSKRIKLEDTRPTESLTNKVVSPSNNNNNGPIKHDVHDVALSLKALSENVSSDSSVKPKSSPNSSQTISSIGSPNQGLLARQSSGSKEKPLWKICNKCKGVIKEVDKTFLFLGESFHDSCFVCTLCLQVLKPDFKQKDGKPYCEACFTNVEGDLEKIINDVPLNVGISVTNQPSNFQIANYNIHPSPSLTFSRPLSINQTVHAHLIDANSNTVINGGFQSGDVRVLRVGSTNLLFTGLKLSKMGPIKHELQSKNSRQGAEFCIQFKIGSRIILSNRFKLVSSCSQLPEHLKSSVRPTKKTSQKSKSGENIQILIDSDQPPSPTSPIPSPSLTRKPITPPPPSSPIVPPYPSSRIPSQDIAIRQNLEEAIKTGNVEAAMQAAKLLALMNVSNSQGL